MRRRALFPALAAILISLIAGAAWGGGCLGSYTFTPSTLPNVLVNAAYSQSVTVTYTSMFCGDGTAAASIIAGAPPPGISATGGNYAPMDFTGTPTAVGVSSFTMQGTEGLDFGYNSYRIDVDFLDVPPSNVFEPFVMKLVANNVAAGCDATHYCPGGLILRSSMAVFIIKSEHGSTYVPPPATGIFADVPAGNAFAPWIEEIYHENITGGCLTNPPRYCPGNNVNRAQMAVFLLKGKWGPAYVPPASAQIFTDVPPSSPFEPWINEIYNEGIMPGCDSTHWCPSSNVNRVAMAVFLVLTFNLGFPAP
jgi:hypothetical protein